MDVSGGSSSGGADLKSSIKKWNVIYPIYLNSKKTVAEGRRIAAAKACPDPTCIEIADSCAYLKIPREIEHDKAYPRDFFQVGRVRVQFKNDDGTPVNPAITKKQLMIQIAELVPKHHGRTKKQDPVASSSAAPTKSKGGKKKK